MLTTYFVNNAAGQNGSDSNAGTSLSAPFLTIQKAASIAEPGDVVDILAGTYRETVTPAHSGTASAPIIYQPYDNQKVVIDGTNIVSGWSDYSGDIYQTSAMTWTMGGQNDQVFVDGQMINYARWPNTTLNVSQPTYAEAGPNTSGYVNSNGYVVNTIYDASLTQPAGYWNGATIHIESGETWIYDEATITSYTRATVSGVSYGVITYTSTYNYQQSYYIAQSGNPFYITGDPYYTFGSFQDLDAAGQFYRDPNSGKLYIWTPNSDSPSAHTIEVKQRTWGFNLSGLSYIDVNGINLFACGINSSSGGSHLLINGINAQYVSQFESYNGDWQATLLSGVSVIGGTGIVLDGAYDTIENSTIAYSAGDGVYLGGANATVYNNVIHDVDYSGLNASGIDSSEFTSTKIYDASISYNTVYNAARTLINVSDLSTCRVDYNLLYDGTLQGVDCGAIYGYDAIGNGSEIDHNYIYDMLNSVPGYNADGIFLDVDSTGFTIDHNVVFNSTEGIKQFETVSNWVYNNTVVNTQISIESIYGTGAGTIANNIMTDPISLIDNTSSLAVIHNLEPPANPDFVNASADNFQLLSGSPAVNAGIVLAPYTNGYVGSAPDLGACEYGAAAWTAGASIAAAAGGALPSPWISAGIGSPAVAGNSSYSNGVFSVSGAGTDIWGTADQFQYAYAAMSGDQTIVARVTSQTDTSGNAKAGVMFRSTTSASSSFVDVLQTPSSGIEMQWRDASGNLGDISASAIANPAWLKLVRSGNVFTGYDSSNGVTWTTIGSVTIVLPAAGLMGLCVTSQSPTQLSTADFDNVSLAAPATATDPATNLAQNDDPGFESPTATNSTTAAAAPWFSWGSAYLSTQYAYLGSQSLAISGTGSNGSSGVGQYFYSITPGTSYTVSVDAMMTSAKPLTGNLIGQLSLLFFGANGLISSYSSPNQITVLSSSSLTGGSLTGSVGSSGWNHYYTTAVAPSGTTYVQVGMDSYSSSSTYGGTAYFDNFEFGPPSGSSQSTNVVASKAVNASQASPTVAVSAPTSIGAAPTQPTTIAPLAAIAPAFEPPLSASTVPAISQVLIPVVGVSAASSSKAPVGNAPASTEFDAIDAYFSNEWQTPASELARSCSDAVAVRLALL